MEGWVGLEWHTHIIISVVAGDGICIKRQVMKKYNKYYGDTGHKILQAKLTGGAIDNAVHIFNMLYTNGLSATESE